MTTDTINQKHIVQQKPLEVFSIWAELNFENSFNKWADASLRLVK